MATLRSLFWLTLFFASTFGFIVLFEHGPKDYVNSCKTEFNSLKELVQKKPEQKKDDTSKIGQ